MAHPITDALEAATTAEERHRIKAMALAALANQVGRSVTRGLYTITLVEPAPSYTRGLLEFNIKVTRTTTGKDVTPADLNPIRVQNPPILIDDPQGDIVRTWVDEQGVTQTRTLSENLPAVMLDIVREIARSRLG